MKCIKLASALALVMGCGVAVSASAGTSNGTISFTGAVGDFTCVVKGGLGTDRAVGDFAVDLGTIEPSELAQQNVPVKPQRFDVTFSNGNFNCGGKTASLTFDSTASQAQIDPATGALKNTQSSGAQNVQIVLLDQNSNPIDLSNAGYVNQLTLNDSPMGNGELGSMTFHAAYMAVGTVTPGEISSSIAYLVNYN
jgi:type 1 fimbria pilin